MVYKTERWECSITQVHYINNLQFQVYCYKDCAWCLPNSRQSYSSIMTDHILFLELKTLVLGDDDEIELWTVTSSFFKTLCIDHSFFLSVYIILSDQSIMTWLPLYKWAKIVTYCQHKLALTWPWSLRLFINNWPDSHTLMS